MRIVITGATAGIGLACARSFCAEGHEVIGLARNAENLALLEKELAGFKGIRCDIADDESLAQLDAAFAEATEGGPVDVLINNAGYSVVGPIELVPLGDWRALFDTNVFGTIGVTRAALPYLRKAARGHVINISSVAGSVYGAFFGPYFASKHALELISKTLRLELRSQGIDVTIIAPGAVKTDFSVEEDAMLERYAEGSDLYREDIEKILTWHEQLVKDGIQPEDVVATIRKAVYAERRKPRYTVPAFPSVLFIAVAKFLPSKWADAIIRRITNLQA